jgi:putative PIN family toxin of toxin-antitoxin system
VNDFLGVVLDTNILVSALLTPGRKPGQILTMVLTQKLRPWYTQKILAEYQAVLSRPKFPIDQAEVKDIIDNITQNGASTYVLTPSTFPMVDETDRKFYDTAKIGRATLITGNKKHYPAEAFIMTPAEFLETVPAFA